MKNNWKERDTAYEQERAKHAEPVPSREYILKILSAHAGPLTRDELVARIGMGPEDSVEALDKRLQAMVRDGQIAQNRRGAYGPVTRMNLITGRVQGHKDGFGFLVRDDATGPDVFLNPRQMKQLMPGDRAAVRIAGRDPRGREEGVVVEVLERNPMPLVGRYMFQQGIAYVVPDNPRVVHDLLIPPGQDGGAKAGQMVVAEITTPPDTRTLPVGRVVEVLGDHLAPGMEIEAAIRAHGLPHKWSSAVDREAAALPDRVGDTDTRGRWDFRGVKLVTIDGEDARDFDDAVLAEPHADGGWKLTVAIADVAAYVRPGTALDREAAERGNSVYFPERVIPMLPEALSNGLCSLNPEVDRLCMVCEMHVDADGEIVRSRFLEGVMHSRARLTYNQVFAALEDPQGPTARQWAAVLPQLQALDQVFHALFRARERRGAIDLDSSETKVVFGADRKIERIVPVARNRAHRIIEECMIAANIEAAKFVIRHKLPAPHRVHQQPDVMKVAALHEFLTERGLRLPGGDRPTPMDYARTLTRARARPDYPLIQSVALRSLMQARYSADPTGHFGLALEHYAHFTSPIRRYPDLLLHRAIKHALHKRKPAEFAYSAADVEARSAHCSATERRADEATRDVVQWLKCEFMSRHVGDEYEAAVTSVASFGLFCELEGLFIEGLVHISALKNDYYVHDAKQHRLRGERGGKVYGLGQRLRVKVVRVNLDERKIDLEPLDQPARTPRGGSPPPRQAPGQGTPPVTRAALALATLLLGGCFASLQSTLPPPGARGGAAALGRPAPALAPGEAGAAMDALRRALAEAARESPLPLQPGDGVPVILQLDPERAFEAQSAQLRLPALDACGAIAGAVMQQPATVVHVVSYAPADSGIEAALGLAARRAASLQDELVREGLFAGRVRAEGREGTPRIELHFQPVVQGREAAAWVPPG
ncbi:MAG TPA: ribonuclease R [Candidatus Binatia bacterium]|nr:ribonuclease R [Candidatus Binatia bacterium]